MASVPRCAAERNGMAAGLLDRLRLDPHVHDLSVTVVSILQRRALPYASNKYPVGFMTDYSTAHHVVDSGEESRHNV
ncbi:MAG TPA: hypothetical protein EYP98_22040, partial [Planctomycetes bacterium]|nr:hypothetical protein [Planctomycetota bacterium]